MVELGLWSVASFVQRSQTVKSAIAHLLLEKFDCPRVFLVSMALLGVPMTVACGELGTARQEPQELGVQVEVGLAGESGRSEFLALQQGDALPLQTFGQGGRHVLLAVRTHAHGSRAYIRAGLLNVQSGAEATTEFGARPSLFYCQDPEVCDLVPFLVPVSAAVYDGVMSRDLRVLLRVETETSKRRSASTTRELLLTLL